MDESDELWTRNKAPICRTAISCDGVAGARATIQYKLESSLVVVIDTLTPDQSIIDRRAPGSPTCWLSHPSLPATAPSMADSAAASVRSFWEEAALIRVSSIAAKMTPATNAATSSRASKVAASANPRCLTGRGS